MKQTLLILCLLTIGQWSQAQDNTLLGRSGRFGVFVSPMVESGPIFGERENQFGGGLAFVIGNGFVGGYASAAADFHPLIIDGLEPDRIDMAQVGLWVGWTPGQNSLIHPVFDLKTGWAAINFDYDDFDGPFADEFDLVDNAFVVQPGFGLEMNVTGFMRVNFNAGYRWTEGVEQPASGDSDFTGWTYTLGVKIGYFGRDHRHCRHHFW